MAEVGQARSKPQKLERSRAEREGHRGMDLRGCSFICCGGLKRFFRVFHTPLLGRFLALELGEPLWNLLAGGPRNLAKCRGAGLEETRREGGWVRGDTIK